MPRQRIHHGRTVYVMPDDFPERLRRLKQESGLPWAEIARRIGTTPYTVWRWVEAGVRPHWRHQMALLALAEDLGLAHLLTAWTLPEEEPGETPAEAVPHPGRVPRRMPRDGGAAATAGIETQKGRRTRTAEGEGTVIRYSPPFI